MKCRKDLEDFLSTIPSNITLVAATKYVDGDEMKVLYQHDITNFGENRVDAFLNKYHALSSLDNIKWHFIGHLQKNKVKLVYDKINYLHSLDSISLANLLNNYLNKPLPCFVEININNEDNKTGLKINDVNDFFNEIHKYQNIKLIGLMMMSKAGSSENELKEQFNQLIKLKSEIETKHHLSLPYLSMGMSDDYLIAIESGATHIRLGRILFED